MEEKIKAVIYARVSTEKQTEDNQVFHLEQWAAQRGYEVSEIYREKETAWKAGHQAELARLLKDAYQHKFDVVIVWALDRISREGAPATIDFYHKMLRYNIKLLSYQEQWTDIPNEFIDIFLALFGTLAKMESDRRSERTKAGIERRRREGASWGRPAGSRDTKQRKRRTKRE